MFVLSCLTLTCSEQNIDDYFMYPHISCYITVLTLASTEQIRMVTFFVQDHSSTHYKTCHHDVMGHLNLHSAKQSLSIIYLSNSPELLYISPFKFRNYKQRQIYLLTDLNNIANV